MFDFCSCFRCYLQQICSERLARDRCPLGGGWTSPCPRIEQHLADFKMSYEAAEAQYRPVCVSVRLPVADQWVRHRKTGEAAEVAVGRPKLAHAVLAAQRRDPRIMDQRSGNPTGGEQRTQNRPMRPRLGQERQSRRFEPSIDLFEGSRQRRRRRIDPRMRHNGEEFVQARPGNGPDRRPFRQFRYASAGDLVERRLLAMRVDEDVGIEGDHAP